jgi:hypothetical protein
MRHYTEDKKRIAIELYFSGDLTSQQVVDRLDYPIRTVSGSMIRKRQTLR